MNFPTGMVFLSGGTDAGSHKYPWSALSENPTDSDYKENYEIANIGQIKNLFSWSLDIINLPDSDGDGIPDNIENIYGIFSESIFNARFLTLRAIGKTFYNASNGISLENPLIVQVIDEKGCPIGGVPISISSATGILSNTSLVSDNNGMAEFTFIPNFDLEETNKVTVQIKEDPFGNKANFIIKNTSEKNLNALTNVFKDFSTDLDPYQIKDAIEYLGEPQRFPVTTTVTFESMDSEIVEAFLEHVIIL